MAGTITEKLDAIRHFTAKSVEYWEARELMPVLGYKKWENFQEAIGRAISAFDPAGEESSHHFLEAKKMIEVGNGAKMEVNDYFLSRPACLITVMNGDSTKEEIAEGQKYFAVQTRRMEKIDRLVRDLKRIALRNRVKDHNTKLNSAAQDARVRRYGLFHGAGIQTMYRMRLSELKARRGIGEKEDWLDRQGTEELAANDFRITQAEAKIRRENIRGEDAAIRAHAQVGGEVREAIGRMGNQMPEELLQEPPIKEIEKRLNPKKLSGPTPAAEQP